MIVNGFQLSLAAIDFNVAPQAKDLFTKVHDDAWYTHAFIIAANNGVDLKLTCSLKQTSFSDKK